MVSGGQTADTIPSEPMRFEEVLVKAEDGVDLFVRRFHPRSRDADRTLVLIHGMAEHGQRYFHVVESMLARGWNLLVPDLRGHGLSGGEPVHVDDFSEYVSDLRQIFDAHPLDRQKTVIVGHSLGGLISARFVQQFPDSVSALALVSPLLRVRVA